VLTSCFVTGTQSLTNAPGIAGMGNASTHVDENDPTPGSTFATETKNFDSFEFSLRALVSAAEHSTSVSRILTPGGVHRKARN
jgi:hypothetical protein